MIFSYLSIHFEIYVLDSIEDKSTSTHYQSIVSFIYSSLRMIILMLITILFKYLNLNRVYYIFIGTLIFTIVFYKVFRNKSHEQS